MTPENLLTVFRLARELEDYPIDTRRIEEQIARLGSGGQP